MVQRSSATDSVVTFKFHWFDLLWICCATNQTSGVWALAFSVANRQVHSSSCKDQRGVGDVGSFVCQSSFSHLFSRFCRKTVELQAFLWSCAKTFLAPNRTVHCRKYLNWRPLRIWEPIYPCRLCKFLRTSLVVVEAESSLRCVCVSVSAQNFERNDRWRSHWYWDIWHARLTLSRTTSKVKADAAAW